MKPASLDGLQMISLHERGGKVQIRDFARPYTHSGGISGLIASLPHLLAADDFRFLVDRVRNARDSGKPVLWGLGGHVIKCGLAPVLIELMHRGFATGFLFNGSTSIHDFEIGLAGHTSEDVESVLPGGRFGVANETGLEMNRAIAEGVSNDLGIGEALGKAPHPNWERRRSSRTLCSRRRTSLVSLLPFTSPSALIHRTCIPQ